MTEFGDNGRFLDVTYGKTHKGESRQNMKAYANDDTDLLTAISSYQVSSYTKCLKYLTCYNSWGLQVI